MLNLSLQKAIFIRGATSGLHTTWTLAKVIFPITIIVVILQQTPLIGWLVKALGPVMGLLGLGGEAAIPLVLGIVLNIYAGLGAILSLSLTVKEVFILAVMISFAHNMFIESGVALKVGVRLWTVLLVRFGLAVLWALIINYGWSGGSELAVYSLVPEVAAAPETWTGVLWLALVTATTSTIQVAAIVFPLMIIIQFLKEHRLLHRFSVKMAPVTRMLGMHPNASLTLAAGFFTGLVYGAGIMIQAVEEHGASRKDAVLAMIFLMASHAIIEDTLLFVPLGIPIWPLIAIRVTTAIVITMATAAVWRRIDAQRVAEPLAASASCPE